MRRQSSTQQWIGRLAVGWASGGIFLAVCLVPNMANSKFHRWIGPLVAVCFGAPTLAIVASRFCVDRVTDYNDGYNQALQDISQPTTHDASPQQVALPQSVAPLPLVGANPPDLRGIPASNSLPAHAPVSAPVHAGDDLSFLDAQVG
jgi:hypothetical protein